MSANFETILDECLARLMRGDSPDARLQQFPAQADELRPLLALAAGLRTVPAPRARPEAVAAGKAKVLAALAVQVSSPVVAQRRRGIFAARLGRILDTKPVWNTGYALRFALGIMIVLMLGATGAAVAASADSLPGDSLYPVKQSVESLRLALTLNAGSKQALEEQFAGQRLREIGSLVQMRRQTTAEFEDVLHAMGEDGWWTIGPFAVRITEETMIVGQPTPGGRVHAQVRVQNDGTLAALRISEEPAHEIEPEHEPGAEGLQFRSPLPVGSPTHEAENESQPVAPHEGESRDNTDHTAPPAQTPSLPFPDDDGPPAVEPVEHNAQPATATVAPHEPPATMPIHHAEPTRLPQPSTLTPAAIHPAEPTAQHPAATPEPAHNDPMPAPAQPTHDAGGGDGEHKSGGND